MFTFTFFKTTRVLVLFVEQFFAQSGFSYTTHNDRIKKKTHSYLQIHES